MKQEKSFVVAYLNMKMSFNRKDREDWIIQCLVNRQISVILHILDQEISL